MLELLEEAAAGFLCLPSLLHEVAGLRDGGGRGNHRSSQWEDKRVSQAVSVGSRVN